MVSGKLIGGLGNQMFIVAAIIGAARRFNSEYCLPENKYFPHLTKFNPGVITAQVYNEPSFEYVEIPIPWCSNFYLSGYFQSPLYWSHCKEEVIQSFNIKPVIREGWVSIHIRRGDYLTKPDYHPVITMDYIQRAVSIFTMTGYNKFFVFGDDPGWNHENINSDNFPDCTFEYSEGRTAIEDMALAAGCTHSVGSNSSYSLWIYYLNPNPNKVGTFPAIWFGKDGSHNNTKDLYPPNSVVL